MLRNVSIYVISIICFVSILLVGCQEADKTKVVSSPTKSEIASLSKKISRDSVQAKGILSIHEAKVLLATEQNVVLFEVSKKQKFEEKHLPNAQNLWRPDYENKTDYPYSGMRASQSAIEQLLSKRGVSADSKIIIYDSRGGCDAIRLAWILREYGHEETYTINGGKVAWEKADFPTTTVVSNYLPPTNYKFTSQSQMIETASIAELERAINNPNCLILDTRTQEEFLGQPYRSKGKVHPWKKGAFTFGCIPGAVHLDWSDAVAMHDDHRLKCLKDLEYNFQCAGVTPDKEIYVYCQSGVRSAHTTFVLKEILGYPNVKNYDGSWVEWSYHHVTHGDVKIERHTSEEEHRLRLAELDLPKK